MKLKTKQIKLLIGAISLLLALVFIPESFDKTTIDQPVVLSAKDSNLYSVISVTDGDTIKIAIDDATETIRLIGVDTPETVHPSEPVECFGREASNKTKSVLMNSKVRIEKDPSQGERDHYGRLLAYVFLEDGTNFNQLLIEEGYAYEYTYDATYKYQSEFKQAQRSAEMNKKGLWGEGVCILN